jgi:hypothetical protein
MGGRDDDRERAEARGGERTSGEEPRAMRRVQPVMRRDMVLAPRIAGEITHDHIDGRGGVRDALDLQADA